MANKEPYGMGFVEVVQFGADIGSQEYHLPESGLQETRTAITEGDFVLLTDCEVKVYEQEGKPLVRLRADWSQGEAGFIDRGQSIGSLGVSLHGSYYLPNADYDQTIQALERAKFVKGRLN